MKISRGSGGRNKVPAEHKALRGTVQPSRQIVSIYPDYLARPDPDEIPPPVDMSDAAKVAWVDHVNVYRQRGQKVDGCQRSLRQYCEIEVTLIAMWAAKSTPNVALINAYRQFAVEFHDTPASQRVAVGSKKQDNAFAKFGT